MTNRYDHGTHACYVQDHCRCDDCTRANRDYERNRIRQKAYGRTLCAIEKALSRAGRPDLASVFGQQRRDTAA